MYRTQGRKPNTYQAQYRDGTLWMTGSGKLQKVRMKEEALERMKFQN